MAAFRYRVLHIAVRGARQVPLRIDATWRWAKAITAAWLTHHRAGCAVVVTQFSGQPPPPPPMGGIGQ